MKKASGVVVVLALLALTACVTTESATNDCLERPSVISASGWTHRQFPAGHLVTPDGSALDARGETWAIEYPYAVTIQSSTKGGQRNDLCMVGGHVTSLHPHATTPWSTWHGTSALTVQRPDFQALQMSMDNVGDGARFTAAATDWAMRGVHMQRAHDDCVENDGMNSGIIDDSLFDGCYVFYSARGSSGSTADGSDDVVTITDSLVRLETMPFIYDNSGPGHGPFWKLSANPDRGRSPQMVIRDTVFRADAVPYNGSLTLGGFDHDLDPATEPLSYLDDCSDNTMVWLGAGPFPGTLPDCFTLTTDPTVWDDAVADWHATRPATP